MVGAWSNLRGTDSQGERGHRAAAAIIGGRRANSVINALASDRTDRGGKSEEK